jgi:Fe-S-cluster containining protein
MALTDRLNRRTRHNPRMSRADAIAQLDELYASLPALECKGLCHDSCTAIDASELERERLLARGVDIGPRYTPGRVRRLIASGHKPRCPALGPLNTCTVYDVRPFICRAFGLVLNRRTGEGLMCEHGCVPDATIDPQEFYRIMLAIEKLSEAVTAVRKGGAPQ